MCIIYLLGRDFQNLPVSQVSGRPKTKTGVRFSQADGQLPICRTWASAQADPQTLGCPFFSDPPLNAEHFLWVKWTPPLKKL